MVGKLVFASRHAYLMPGWHIAGADGEEEVWTLTSFYSSLNKPEGKQKIIRIYLNSALATRPKWFASIKSYVFYIALCCFLYKVFWIALLLNNTGQINWACPKCSLCGYPSSVAQTIIFNTLIICVFTLSINFKFPLLSFSQSFVASMWDETLNLCPSDRPKTIKLFNELRVQRHKHKKTSVV